MTGDFTRWAATETAATLTHDIPRDPDPWARIPNPDADYAGTELELREPARCDKALDTASEVCPRCFRQHTWLMEG